MAETQVAENQEELFVKVEEEPQAPAAEVKVEETLSPASPDPGVDLQAQLKEYEQREERRKNELAEARRREDEHRRRAEDSQRQAQQSYAEIIEARIGNVSSALAASEAEANQAEAEYAAAMEAAQYAAAAKAQRKIAAAEAQIARLAEAKEYWTAQKTAPPPQPRQPQQQPRQEGWSADNAISSLKGASRDWARNHAEYFSSERQYMKVQAAHMEAVAEGYELESPEYFSHIEQRLGIKKPATDAGQEKPKRSGGPPAAPVNAGSQGNGVSGNVVTLTPGEARAAEDGTHVWNYDDPSGRFKKGQPIGRQEFARRKREMMRQGAYDRSYTES